jgi:hypothetical protein
MTRSLHVSLGMLLALALVSCTATQEPAAKASQQLLEQKYPGAKFAVEFDRDQHFLLLTVDTALFGNYKLDDARRRALGEQMARLALEQYRDAASIDSITIQFVQEREGSLVSRSWSMKEEKFTANALR